MRSVILSMVLVVFLSGCKALKNTTTSDLSSASPKHIMKAYKHSLFKANTLSVKLNTTLAVEGREQSMTVKLRMKKDEVIWMSAQYMGLSVAKMMITPGSIKFYDKLNGSFYDGDFEFLKRKLGVDLSFDHLQSLLLGQAFNGFKETNYDTHMENNQLVVTYDPYIDGLFLLFSLDTEVLKLSKVETHDDHKGLLVRYIDYQHIDKEYIPLSVEAKFTEDHEVRTQLKMVYSNVRLNETLSFPFKIPEGYTPLNF